ncbi:MAG TPA: hypothetical protein VE820_04790 [Sphingomicrobium sp.]|nr:hypothetical protein [Sphingomicrobium sp.]
MPADEAPPNIDKLAARMSDGLKTCHTIVSNYKALLETEQNDLEPPADTEESNQGEA